MIKRFGRKINLGIVALAIFGLCGFTDVSLEDIETSIMQQEYEQAKQMSLQMLSQGVNDEQSNEVRYYLGLCDLRLKNFSEARKIFTDLTKQKIGVRLRDKAYLGLFDSYYLKGEYKKADQTAQRLLKISPESEFLSLIYLKRARTSLKLTLWDQARANLNKIIAEFPESLEAYTAKQLLSEKQHFAVQVGAFIEQKRAESLASELQGKGEYAYILETVDSQGTKFYRVRVGQLALLSEAQKLKSKLSKAGYPTEIYP